MNSLLEHGAKGRTAQGTEAGDQPADEGSNEYQGHGGDTVEQIADLGAQEVVVRPIGSPCQSSPKQGTGQEAAEEGRQGSGRNQKAGDRCNDRYRPPGSQAPARNPRVRIAAMMEMARLMGGRDEGSGQEGEAVS